MPKKIVRRCCQCQERLTQPDPRVPSTFCKDCWEKLGEKLSRLDRIEKIAAMQAGRAGGVKYEYVD